MCNHVVKAQFLFAFSIKLPSKVNKTNIKTCEPSSPGPLDTAVGAIVIVLSRKPEPLLGLTPGEKTGHLERLGPDQMK